MPAFAKMADDDQGSAKSSKKSVVDARVVLRDGQGLASAEQSTLTHTAKDKGLDVHVRLAVPEVLEGVEVTSTLS